MPREGSTGCAFRRSTAPPSSAPCLTGNGAGSFASGHRLRNDDRPTGAERSRARGDRRQRQGVDFILVSLPPPTVVDASCEPNLPTRPHRTGITHRFAPPSRRFFVGVPPFRRSSLPGAEQAAARRACGTPTGSRVVLPRGESRARGSWSCLQAVLLASAEVRSQSQSNRARTAPTEAFTAESCR